MSDSYCEGIDDTIISSLDDAAQSTIDISEDEGEKSNAQSTIDISDDEGEKSNGGPIRNNKNTISKVDEFFIRTKDFQKCRICANEYSEIGSISTGTLKTNLEKKHQLNISVNLFKQQ